MRPRRTVGVDWSGAAASSAASRAIWCAVVEDGRLLSLESGRDRAQIVSHLIELTCSEPETLIGLDFSFSAPAWFVVQMGFRSAGELWRWAERSLQSDPHFPRSLDPPFWGPGIRSRPELDGDPLRATERQIARPGVRPSSFFQLSGPGSVGAQSLYGMSGLLSLCDAGLSIWPFDPPRLPCVVEAYPRMYAHDLLPGGTSLTGRHLRIALCAHFAETFGEWAELCIENQDACDAAIIAIALDRADDPIAELERTRDTWDPLEGAIAVFERV